MSSNSINAMKKKPSSRLKSKHFNLPATSMSKRRRISDEDDDDDDDDGDFKLPTASVSKCLEPKPDNHVVPVKKSKKQDSSTYLMQVPIPNFNSIVENLRGLKIATDDEAKSMMQYGELQWNVGTTILFHHY